MYPARFPAFRTVPLAAVAGAVTLAVLATACGSTARSGTSAATRMAGTGHTTSASASGAALRGTAASALATKALANTEDSASVRVTGAFAGTSSGSGVSFDLTLVKAEGCQGSIALSKAETFQIVETGGYAWVRPSAAYYAAGHVSKATRALLADKYIKVKTNTTQFADLVKICSSSGLFGALPTTTGTGYVATPATYSGRPAYELTEAGNPGEAFITKTAAPLLLKIAETGSDGGAITFSNYNLVTSITLPSAAESIDGSALGV
jgi:hypothetical protein